MGVEIEGRGQRRRSCGEILIELTERGRQERLTLDSLAITLVVDEIYVDRIGPIVG